MKLIKILFFICLTIILTQSQNQTKPRVNERGKVKINGGPGRKNKNKNGAQDGEEKEVIADNAIISNNTWLDEWDKYMKDFTADDMMSFEIQGKSEEILLEDIVKPCHIRGAYFVGYDSKDPITFSIRAPNKQIIYKRLNKREGIFHVDLNHTGQYELIFSNKQYSSLKHVSFTIDVSDNEEHAVKADIDPMLDKLDEIQKEINEYYYQTKFATKKRDSHAQVFKKTHNYLLLFSVAETLVILICTAWQIWYIKKILDNRSLV